MKATLDLPDELFREVKLRAVMQRRTVKDLVAQFLRQGLGMAAPAQAPSPPASAIVQIRGNGLPVFKCRANAPASRMNTKQLLQLEQAALAEQDKAHAGLPV